MSPRILPRRLTPDDHQSLPARGHPLPSGSPSAQGRPTRRRAPAAWQSGGVDTAPLYTERLGPPPSMHLVSVLLGAFGFLAVTPFSSVPVAVAVWVVVTVTASVLVVRTS